MAKAEFDQFAGDYEKILSDCTRFGADDPSYFARYKVKLVRKASSASADVGSFRILDFGCGVGQSTAYFREAFPKAELLGVDVSPDSIAVAKQDNESNATFECLSETEPLPYPENSIDIAFTACVLHHIPHADHPRVLKDILRVLRPKGRLFVFEHNPYNPLTVKIVKACPFDENAVLIKPAIMKDRMRAAGFQQVYVNYCLFMPRALEALRPLEAALSWCPAGAQYFACGTKGAMS